MNNFTRRKFIVTGGCGFIGSHLVERLVADGNDITVIDDLSTGLLSNLEKVEHLVDIRNEKAENFDFHSLGKVDGVFHLAAQASVPISIEKFFFSSSSNMLSTFKVIEFCSDNQIPLVYATSSAVYGNLPFGIESGEIQLLSPYATDKYAMEMYLSACFNLHSLPSFGLRFFNVYGPKQDSSSPYSGVISLFIDQLLKNQPLKVNGGFQTRDFVFVKDVVDCLVKSYHYLLNNKEAQVSNVLTGVSISINSLIEHISAILNVKPVCVYRELQPGDPIASEGSTKLLESLLKIKTDDFVNIKKGLEETVSWAKIELNYEK